MTNSAEQLIDGYLDECLTSDEQDILNQWIKAAPENAQRFAEAMLLHERLRREHLSFAAMSVPSNSLATVESSRESHARNTPAAWRRMRRVAVTAATFLASSFVLVVIWRSIGGTPASAATVEINRLIEANVSAPDRTYVVDVEEQSPISKRELPEDAPERTRPAKPSIDRAVLHVRRNGRFVLIRRAADGQSFLTGSNGEVSWAIKSDGPVRSSSDLTRFSHDVPGHEHSMPLISIKEGLEKLREAYDVQLLPIEKPDDPAEETLPSRLIVAVKKRGFRGPQRVEIHYTVQSGLIRQMRFIEMPYGPDRLTLRLTCVEQRDLGADFFDHEAHHAADRIVLVE